MSERLTTRRKREEAKRICEGKDCEIVLSIYNKQAICASCFQRTKPADRPRLRFGEF